MWGNEAMLVKCNLCGGKNEIHPGQEMLFCSYCGSALALGDTEGIKHLILPHKRNDKNAREALVSLLTKKKMARPKDIKVEFAFVPYLMIEDKKGKMRTFPAPGAPSWAAPLPFPPSGNYCFFDEALSENEKTVPLKEVPKDAHKILHLPLYRIGYNAAGEKWDAIVTGENLLVISADFPPRVPSSLNTVNVLCAAALFVAFLFVGRLGHGLAGRLAFIMIAASAGFAWFKIRERMAQSAR